MLQKKTGFPEDGELVLCTVTKIYPNSVFANLDEYSRSGMIDISEVAAGRIRNIRDFVKEGKVIVCKVLRINEQKGHIDLSLRRVSESMHRNKVNEIKREQKAEKILEFVAKKIKKETLKLFTDIEIALKKKGISLADAFDRIAFDELKVEELDLEKNAAAELKKEIKDRIKPQEFAVKATVTLSTFASDGVAAIKEAFSIAEKEHIDVSYLGAGKYMLELKGKEYKILEKTMNNVCEKIADFIKTKEGAAEYAISG